MDNLNIDDKAERLSKFAESFEKGKAEETEFEGSLNELTAASLQDKIETIKNLGLQLIEKLQKGDEYALKRRVIPITQQLKSKFKDIIVKKNPIQKFFAERFGRCLNEQEKQLYALIQSFQAQKKILEEAEKQLEEAEKRAQKEKAKQEKAQNKLKNKTAQAHPAPTQFSSEPSSSISSRSSSSTATTSPSETPPSSQGTIPSTRTPTKSSASSSYSLPSRPTTPPPQPSTAPKISSPIIPTILSDKELVPAEHAKEGYVRVISQKELSISELEGSSQSQSLATIKHDIDQFTLLSDKDLTSSDQAKLKELSSKIETAAKFAKDLEKLADRRPPKTLDQITTEAHTKLEKLKVGEEMLIPGGYASRAGNRISGHSIIYGFRKEPSKSDKDEYTYTMTIYNTGEGDEAFKDSSFLARMSDRAQGLVYDVSFSDVSLTDKNLKALLQQNDPSGNHSMKTLEAVLKDNVLKGKTPVQGRSHLAQKNGTCNHSSVCSWIETALSPSNPKAPQSPLFQAFELYMARTGLEYLKSGLKNFDESLEKAKAGVAKAKQRSALTSRYRPSSTTKKPAVQKEEEDPQLTKIKETQAKAKTLPKIGEALVTKLSTEFQASLQEQLSSIDKRIRTTKDKISTAERSVEEAGDKARIHLGKENAIKARLGTAEIEYGKAGGKKNSSGQYIAPDGGFLSRLGRGTQQKAWKTLDSTQKELEAWEAQERAFDKDLSKASQDLESAKTQLTALQEEQEKLQQMQRLQKRLAPQEKLAASK